MEPVVLTQGKGVIYAHAIIPEYLPAGKHGDITDEPGDGLPGEGVIHLLSHDHGKLGEVLDRNCEILSSGKAPLNDRAGGLSLYRLVQVEEIHQDVGVNECRFRGHRDHFSRYTASRQGDDLL